jgi:hypothetical protein
VNLGNTNNMIFDHDSLEFASYNNIDASGTTGANNLTFQNSIIADPILDQQFNFHWQGNQGTFINNIFANAHNRSILAKGNTQFVNNSIYNYQAGFTTGDSSGDFDFDIVNNYFVAGPSTTSAGDAFYQVDGNQTRTHRATCSNNRDGHLNGSTTAPVQPFPTRRCFQRRPPFQLFRRPPPMLSTSCIPAIRSRTIRHLRQQPGIRPGGPDR